MDTNKYKVIILLLKQLGMQIDFKQSATFNHLIAQYYKNDIKLITLSAFHAKSPEGFDSIYLVNLSLNNTNYTYSLSDENEFIININELINKIKNFIERLNKNGF